MTTPERKVLHVLPHPGGGGEMYVDLLDNMPGYQFTRVYLSRRPEPSPRIARGVVEALRAGRSHDLVHAHGEVAAGLCLPLLATRPTVVTLHGLHLVRRLSGVRRRAAVLNLRAVLRSSNRTICVSQSEHDELTRIVGTEASKKAVVIRNGVRIPPERSETDRLSARAELGISEHEVVGIWVGSLDERKDPLTAVRAANRAEVTLLVVGDGPLREHVEREAGPPVHVLGQRDDVPRLLGAADLYVSTSLREGLSLSLLEAMASGLAPIVTDLPENREAVGEAGVAVSVVPGVVLEDDLRRLVDDGVERAALGDRARQRTLQIFGAEAMIERTRSVYQEVLAGHDGS